MILLASAAMAGTAAGAAERFSIGVPAEVDLVGLAFGVHPEVTWRPIQPDGGFHLRAGTGLLVGPELVLVPLSVGVRELFWPRGVVHPGLGVGVQLQSFFPRQHAPVGRLDTYLEALVGVRAADAWHVEVQTALETGMFPGFGLGFAARVGVRRDLGGR